MTGSFSWVDKAFETWRLQGLSLPCVLGISGAQGSGKSTLAQQLVTHLGAQGLRAGLVSLDDLYLSQAERLALSRSVHPLLKTRGVPGTHDIDRALGLISAFRAKRPLVIPRFDKSTDDPYPRNQWAFYDEPLDVLVFEGWCLGAIPETDNELIAPVNALERDHDAAASWRHYVNARLASDYQRLFRAIDRLVYLKAPDIDAVYAWRCEQEEALVLSRKGRAMTRAEIAQFVQYFERLTRSSMRKLPFQADLTLELDTRRQVMRALPLGLSPGEPPRGGGHLTARP